MKDGFSFGGKSTADFAMHAEKYPGLGAPRRKVTKVQVPGRNGDIHYDEGAFENYPQRYECYFHGEQSAPDMAHGVKGWLLGAAGYRRLEDVYDPTHFRMASFTGPMDIENRLNQYGRCVVEFDCMPQAFLKGGEFPVEFTTNGTLYNPTEFVAIPLVRLYGSGSGSVGIGGVAVQVLEIEDQLVLDCESMNCYRDGGEGAAENKNRAIDAPEFPSLGPGENAIILSGGITKIEIIPRWWEL